MCMAWLQSTAHHEPVVKLTEQVSTETGEENESVVYKQCVVYSRLSSMISGSKLIFCGVQACKTLPIRRMCMPDLLGRCHCCCYACSAGATM